MPTLHFSVSRRPIRIGWCVRAGETSDLRKALQFSHCLWGGRFNPIIPVDDSGYADEIIRVFRVDALWPVADDPEVRSFTAQRRHLPWPLIADRIFETVGGREEPAFLDLRHPVLRIEEGHRRNLLPHSFTPTIAEWDDEDTLSDVFLATLGDFPVRGEIGVDYRNLIETRLEAEKIELPIGGKISTEFWTNCWPSDISTFDLRPDGLNHWDTPGVFVGDVGNAVDLTEFWNLRAAGIELLFLDPNHDDRLRSMIEAFLDHIRSHCQQSEHAPRPLTSVWSRPDFASTEYLKGLDPGAALCRVSDGTWNGLNVTPPPMVLDHEFTVASVEREGGRLRATVSLSTTPFEKDLGLGSQRLITSLSAGRVYSTDEGACFRPPFVPQLNEFYGREMTFLWNAVRSEPESLGILTRASDSHVSLSAIDQGDIIVRMFGECGITARPSDAGRVARRLIHQLGGLQGCRVFKIRGVRELIRKYSPDQAFARSAAEMLIGNVNPATNQPQFGDYERLHIERRDKPKLTPHDAFQYLLKQKILRTGLNITCPSCELEFWKPLDDLRAEPSCQYCGVSFNLELQLRDRGWTYRRSGLFGRPDDQKGAVPVCLTLQQLNANFHDDQFLFSPGLDLQWDENPRRRCEADLVIVTKSGTQDRRKPTVVLGECKAAGPIEENDVTNLCEVADKMDGIDVQVYLLFAKTCAFTGAEIGAIKKGQGRYQHRIIILSNEELEPYFITERFRDSLPSYLQHGMTAETLAQISAFRYLRDDAG